MKVVNVFLLAGCLSVSSGCINFQDEDIVLRPQAVAELKVEFGDDLGTALQANPTGFAAAVSKHTGGATIKAIAIRPDGTVVATVGSLAAEAAVKGGVALIGEASGKPGTTGFVFGGLAALQAIFAAVAARLSLRKETQGGS